MSELVSVIIPFYNGVNWLFEAVRSVFNQTYNELEVIVINDGSKEDVGLFLSEFEDRIIYVYQENQGAAVARNKGINISKGKYITFLDSDDIWMPNKLKTQIDFIKENNYYWAHSSYIRFWDNNYNKQKLILCNLYGKILPKSLIWNPIATPTVIILGEVLRNDNKLRFDEKLTVGEDSYLWRHIGEKYVLGLIDEPLVKVRIRGTNAALIAYKQIEHRAQMYEEINKYKHFFSVKLLYYYSFYTFRLCYLINKTMNFIVKKLGIKKDNIDFIFKLLYIYPYVNFKIINFCLKNKNENINNNCNL